MAKEKKTQAIQELTDEISRSKVIVVTDYRGIGAKDMTVLRREMRKAKNQYRVVKDTLAILAARQAKREKLESMLAGPVALTFGYEDPSKSVKAILDYARTANLKINIKGGLLGDRLMSTADIQALATLPSREVLLAMLAGSLRSPVQRLHYVISAPLAGLVGVLQGRIRKLEAEPKPVAA